MGVTPRSDAHANAAERSRNATRFHGELLVVYVRQPELKPADQEALDRNLHSRSRGRSPAFTFLKVTIPSKLSSILPRHME